MDRIVIGYIAKPQGVKGEVKISPLTDNVNRFSKLKKVFVENTEYDVQSSRVSPNGVYLKLNGVDDRNMAELLREKPISVDRKDAVKLQKDRYFIVDIVGCDVYVAEEKIGKLTDVLQYGSADVYVVNTQKGNAMFPAIARILTSVDVENKKIILDKEAFDDLVVYEE